MFLLLVPGIDNRYFMVLKTMDPFSVGSELVEKYLKTYEFY